MADVALFPVPIPLSTEEVTDGLNYRSTLVSLGTDAANNLETISASDTRSCVQKVLKILLTRKGSIPSRRNEGTNLLNLLRVGYNSNTLNEDVIMILIDAQSQCIKSDNDSNTPPSARLASIELLELVLLDAGHLKLSIGVTTSSGQAASFDLQV